MKAPLLDVRYVLISDYATVDHQGKLVIAGLYTEDLVVQTVPSVLNSLVLTIVAETPAKQLDFVLKVETPSGKVLMVAGVQLPPKRLRTVLDLERCSVFSLAKCFSPKAATTRSPLPIARVLKRSSRSIRFRVVVNSTAQAGTNFSASVEPSRTNDR